MLMHVRVDAARHHDMPARVDHARGGFRGQRAGGSDGGYPAELAMDKAGNLFGSALTSPTGYGLIFELEKPTVAGRLTRRVRPSAASVAS